MLELLLCFFNDNDALLQLEGLFRKSVSIDEENEILMELNSRNYEYMTEVEDPHVIASTPYPTQTQLNDSWQTSSSLSSPSSSSTSS